MSDSASDLATLTGPAAGRPPARLRRAGSRARLLAVLLVAMAGALPGALPGALLGAASNAASPVPQGSTASALLRWDACGLEPAKADGGFWTCSFVDNFNGWSLDRSKWAVRTQWITGSLSAFACYPDDPSVVDVGGGSLNLTVRRVATPVACNLPSSVTTAMVDAGATAQDGDLWTNYVAGAVSTAHLFSQQYGRFEARVKNTATSYPGLHESFWLWPDDRVPSTDAWPTAGEIDVSETYSVVPHRTFPFLHYAADALGGVQGLNTAYDCAAERGVWNTYTLTWSPNRIEILVNGKSCLVNTSGDPAFQKPYVPILSQQLGNVGNVYDGRAPLPATLRVDYVKVWR